MIVSATTPKRAPIINPVRIDWRNVPIFVAHIGRMNLSMIFAVCRRTGVSDDRAADAVPLG